MSFFKAIALFFLFTLSGISFAQTTISGKITDASNGEFMSYTTVVVKGTNVGTFSNDYGFYSLTIPDEHIKDGKVTILVIYAGYANKEVTIDIADGTTHNVEMGTVDTNLDEVVVTFEKTAQQQHVESTEMSTTRLEMKNIRTIPSIGGETDIIKVVQLLPGVQGGTEGGTGMFVRGGDADQNLVILDESTVYNLSHLFGFFSVFNPDAIKDLTMIKGAFPSNYGGRISSILDIRMKEGHDSTIHGAGGIGLLSSRMTLEGPIKKDKMSFLVAGRRSYIDQVFKAAGLVVPYYFYDINGKVNYKVDDKNRLFYSFYLGNDVLAFDGEDVDNANEEPSDTSAADLGLDFGFRLGNVTNTLRWNHIYNPKLFSNISLINTSFKYDIQGKLAGNNILIQSNVFDLGIKADFDYYPSADHDVKFGAQFINHTFKPNILSTSGDISDFVGSREGERLYTQEMAIYAHSDRDLNERFRIKYGLRISGATVKERAFANLEPRLAGRYLIDENNAVKLSYSRMVQYMHRVSSSTVALPTDLWYPITKNIKPQSAHQIATGYEHVFEKKDISVTIEGYYKWMNNLIEYREGASLILNDEFEDELLQGRGNAWGGELLIKKEEGKLNGWLSYTLSWANRDFDELNGGDKFFAKYDRRHTGSIVVNYQLGKRWKFSGVWVYQTGSRFTAQIGQYFMPNSSLTGVDLIPLYTKRNEVRMAPSHRLDLNFVLTGREKNKDRRFQSEWSFGCYNFYNQAQPYRIDIVPLDDGVGFKYQQPGLFGFIPSIAYNFRF